MLKRVTRVLIAFIVALGVAMPVGAGAMSMPGDMVATVADQPCQRCPQLHQTGSTTSDKMPGCQALACINAPAVLPSPVLLPGRILLEAPYVSPVAVHVAGTEPAPDPFPPRPVVLL
jgi:hypothetical protein